MKISQFNFFQGRKLIIEHNLQERSRQPQQTDLQRYFGAVGCARWAEHGSDRVFVFSGLPGPYEGG